MNQGKATWPIPVVVMKSSDESVTRMVRCVDGTSTDQLRRCAWNLERRHCDLPRCTRELGWLCRHLEILAYLLVLISFCSECRDD